MSITYLGLYFAISLFQIGLFSFGPRKINEGNNLIMLIIALELLLLSIGLLFAHFSFILDDFLGVTLTFYLLVQAGSDAAILLTILVIFYPTRGSLSLKS